MRQPIQQTQQNIRRTLPTTAIAILTASIAVGLWGAATEAAEQKAAERKAAEQWTEVTTNAVGDRFLIDRNSIERSQNTVRFWEYREFKQPNNAFFEFEVAQPVYGVMIYRSVDCTSGVERTRRLVIFDQNRQVIQRVNYDDDGSLNQPMAGSSAAQVIRYACNRDSQP